MKTTRRDFLSIAGASAAVIGIAGCEHEPTPATRHGDAAVTDVVSPYGRYQPGILTPPQHHVLVTAYDLHEDLRRTAGGGAGGRRDGTQDDLPDIPGGPPSGTPSDGPNDGPSGGPSGDPSGGPSGGQGGGLGAGQRDGDPRAGGQAAMIGVLRRWSPAIAAMSVADGAVPELTGLRAARLTVTVGIGPALPGKIGITSPPELAALPPMPGDRLVAERSGGDVCVQVCADDATVAVQATAALTRMADGVLVPRWQQSGFRSPRPDGTVRNLFGFKDGSANPTEPATLAETLWITGPAAYADGTHLVVRHITMDTAAFARLPVTAQEAAIGRRKDSGAPLGGGAETDTPNLFTKTADGRYVIPVDAHIRRAHALAVGAEMLRRGYNYANSPDDQGLLFLAFQKSPDVFVRTQARLAERDALTRFTETRGSALFFILPGMRPGEWLGQRMLTDG